VGLLCLELLSTGPQRACPQKPVSIAAQFMRRVAGGGRAGGRHRVTMCSISGIHREDEGRLLELQSTSRHSQKSAVYMSSAVNWVANRLVRICTPFWLTPTRLQFGSPTNWSYKSVPNRSFTWLSWRSTPHPERREGGLRQSTEWEE